MCFLSPSMTKLHRPSNPKGLRVSVPPHRPHTHAPIATNNTYPPGRSHSHVQYNPHPQPPITPTSPFTDLALHPLLRYTNGAGPGEPCCPLSWDFRDPPYKVSTYQHSRRHSYPFAPRWHMRPVSQIDLSQHATQPPVRHLTITCGVLPYPWRISARSPHGVSVLDVLLAIYNSLSKPIRQSEFLNFTPPKQARITATFYRRCAHSPDPQEEKMRGLRRSDCLGVHTRFGGLSLEVQGGVSCVLTLDRNESSEVHD